MALSRQYGVGLVTDKRLVANVVFDGHVRCRLSAEYRCLLHTSKTGSLQVSCLSGKWAEVKSRHWQVQRSVKGQRT
jgi:hypothetical protein